MPLSADAWSSGQCKVTASSGLRCYGQSSDAEILQTDGSAASKELLQYSTFWAAELQSMSGEWSVVSKHMQPPCYG